MKLAAPGHVTMSLPAADSERCTSRMSHGSVPGRFALALLLVVAAGACASTATWAGESVASDGPLLTIEEAIGVAKRCVLERHVRLVGSFIELARFERNPRGDRGPFWRVSWAYSREIKGGQVFVSVFGDRTCDVTFGE